MWMTLAEAKASTLADIASACPSSTKFVEYVNQAARQLLTRGNWMNTVQKIRICSYTGCIVWPRWVELPLAVMACGSNITLKGNWFEFMPVDGGDLRSVAWQFGPSGGAALGGTLGYSAIAAVNQTYTPVQREIVGHDGQYLRAYLTRNADIGKTLTVFGVDQYGQTIRTTHPDGVYKDGVVITLAKPFAGTSMKVKAITRVLKDRTAGMVNLYQYDATGDQLIDCALYEPSEMNPIYQRTVVNAGIYNRWLGSGGNGECCAVPYTALVKMKFIPAYHDEDAILIDNLDALKLMITAIKMGDAGDIASKRQYELDAVREMNLQLRNIMPQDQIPVSVNPFGKALPFSRPGMRGVF
jgi:hypothetical protein